MAHSNSLLRYPQYAATMQQMETYKNGPLTIYGLTPREAQTIRTQFYGYRKTFAAQARNNIEMAQQVLFAESLTVRIRDITPDELKLRHKGRATADHCKVLVCAPFNMLAGDLDAVVVATIEEQVQKQVEPDDEFPAPSKGVASFLERFKDA